MTQGGGGEGVSERAGLWTLPTLRSIPAQPCTGCFADNKEVILSETQGFPV